MADDNVNFDEIFNTKNNDKPEKISISSETKHAQTPVARKEENKKGCIGGLMYFIFVISISIILACLAWTAATDVLGLKSGDTAVSITLSKDNFTFDEREYTDKDGQTKTEKHHTADLGYVAEKLKDEGVIKYKWLFKAFCAIYGADEKLDPGTYQLKGTYDYRALVNKMQSGSSAMVTKSITFPEGYSMNKIFKKLDEEGVCEFDDLMDAAANATFNYSFLEGTEKGDASRLEGFLFPDTYEFYEGMPASSAINKFLEGFHYKLTAEMIDWQKESGYTWREIITVASMIEKEASDDNRDRCSVASVIYNRLKEGWPLQIDSTTLYEYPDHTGAPTKEMLDKDSPYNTRINKGLPPSPICSPGLKAIKAALQPNDTDYMFYALNTETGTHEFFKSSSQFDAFVATQNYD